MSNTRWKLSSVRSANIPGAVTPALLTRMCSTPSESPAARAAAASAAARSRTSSATLSALSPLAQMRSATAEAASASTSLTSTAAPAEASASATAAPIPLPDPVTKADRPVRSNSDLWYPINSFSEVPRHVVLLGISHAAVGLQCPVGRGETGVGAQVLRGIGLAPTGFPVVVEPGGFAQHQLGGVKLGKRGGQRELDALIHADRAAEDVAFVAVFDRLLQGDPADAQCLSGDQHPFRVEAVEDVLKALALLTNSILNRNVQVINEQLVGADRVATHLADRPHVHPAAVQVGEEQRHPVGLLGDLGVRLRPGEQQDFLRLERLGDPYFSAVDDVVVTVALGTGCDARGVEPSAGFG